MRKRHRLSGIIAFAHEPNWFSIMICKDLSSRHLFTLHYFISLAILQIVYLCVQSMI